MNEFFGIDMTYIMIALVTVLLLAVASVAYVLLRNRVMFLVGVRNIPRRRAQTILIIVGLMLSTLIISTALSIGDTVDYSVTDTTYDSLASVDEIIAIRAGDDEESTQNGEPDDDTTVDVGFVSAIPIPTDEAQRIIRRIKEMDTVDGAVPVFRGIAAVSNPAKGQTEPFALVMGLPDDMTGFEEDLQTTSGQSVQVGGLAPGEVYAGSRTADKLDIEAGDTISLFAQGRQHDVVVKAIVRDRVLTGSLLGQTFGFTMPFDDAAEMFGRPGEVDMIVVSNRGGVRGGLDYSEDVTAAINRLLEGTPWGAQALKADLVEQADIIASFMTTFFVVLGLFSIAAGMLLIFLIFVMLAAERKVEMGMIRAVGTRRSHLIQMFMSEGMVYNMVSAAVGCGLGILVSIAMINIMARMFADFGLQVSFHVTVRSLIISYSVGVVLTFITVVFSSWRIGNLNIVSAIRDTDDPVPEKGRRGNSKGLGRVIRYVAWVLFKPATWGEFFGALGLIVLGVVLGLIGFGLFFAAASVYGAGTIGGAAGVLLGVIGGLTIAFGAAAILIGLSGILQWGPLMLIAGPLLALQGWDAGQAFSFGAGISFIVVGAALLAQFLGAPARPVFTVMGLVMLVFWLLYAGGNIPNTGHLSGDIEMFFLSGVTMVIAGTFVLVYNADLILKLLTLTGERFSSIMPSIKTAVAYPLANKFRTGMTIAMISLVMFALVMMSTMNSNFDRIYLSEDALAGFDVLVTENPGSPIQDLPAALEAQGLSTDGIAGVDTVRVANSTVARFTQLNVEDPDQMSHTILGMSPGFMENNAFTFQAIAEGFGSEQEVFDAVRSGNDYAIIDANVVGGDDFGGASSLEGVEYTDKTFKAIPIEVLDKATGQTARVQIIGILSTEASLLFEGLYLPQDVFDGVFAEPETTLHYVRLQPGADARETARDIERTLLAQGVQAESLRQIISDMQAQSRGFLYLLQGFMGIGLFVGIAAVGVIAFRTVVERRQQIGMLRAIGYSRRAIALSFLMESSFTALLGILSGITLGLLLAYQLATTDEFVSGGVDSFYIPWVQIIGIGLFAFIASLVMTIIPSRQASSIPIAEALRYE